MAEVIVALIFIVGTCGFALVMGGLAGLTNDKSRPGGSAAIFALLWLGSLVAGLFLVPRMLKSTWEQWGERKSERRLLLIGIGLIMSATIAAFWLYWPADPQEKLNPL